MCPAAVPGILGKSRESFTSQLPADGRAENAHGSSSEDEQEYVYDPNARLPSYPYPYSYSYSYSFIPTPFPPCLA